jgi:CheY-like chemotaxis protein
MDRHYGDLKLNLNGANKIVLIVDDEEEIRNLLDRLFRREGFATITAKDALMELQDNDVDLVITDIRMPGMDGLELIGQIHEIKPQMPVVVISGYGSFETVMDAVDKGAFFFVSKPFNQSVILEAAMKGLRLPQPFHESSPSPPSASLTLNFSFQPDTDLISKANHMISSAANLMGYPTSQSNIAIPFVADELMMISLRQSSKDSMDTITASIKINMDETILSFQSERKVFDQRLLPKDIRDFDLTVSESVGLMMARRYSNSLEFGSGGGTAVAVIRRKKSGGEHGGF